MITDELTKAQQDWLAKIVAAYPHPVTVEDLTYMGKVRDAGLILHWDMWPDGRVRYVATAEGRAVLKPQEPRNDDR